MGGTLSELVYENVPLATRVRVRHSLAVEHREMSECARFHHLSPTTVHSSARVVSARAPSTGAWPGATHRCSRLDKILEREKAEEHPCPTLPLGGKGETVP